MIDEPKIVQMSPQRMAFIHVTCPREKIQEVMGPGYLELIEEITSQGLEASGPWFTHHRKMDPEVFDFEICVPIQKPVQPSGRVMPGEVPSVKAARTTYHGPYEGLAEAWGKLDAWLAGEGHEPADDLWEVYAVGPEAGPDSSAWQTELNRPLRAQRDETPAAGKTAR
jgi:effector-binding domain-containing protein